MVKGRKRFGGRCQRKAGAGAGVHAALCETLTNYNAALEDYNDLLELGENTAAKRDEVLSAG